jgi:hypothetical protein
MCTIKKYIVYIHSEYIVYILEKKDMENYLYLIFKNGSLFVFNIHIGARLIIINYI